MPIQALAATDMRFQHQLVVDSVVAESAHPCHQDSMAQEQGAQKAEAQHNNSECDSCSLCMMLAIATPEIFLPANLFSQDFYLEAISFHSQYVSDFTKPPIL